MNFYIIKFNNNKYMGASKNKFDHELRFTNEINDAHSYISIDALEDSIKSLLRVKNEMFQEFRKHIKGSVIVNKDTGDFVKNLRIYSKTIINFQVEGITEKAIKIKKIGWLPKSQIELFENEIGISDFFWDKQLVELDTFLKNNIVDLKNISLEKISEE